MLLLTTLRTLVSSRGGLALVALLGISAIGLLSGPAGFRPEPQSAEATSLHEIRKLLASDAEGSDLLGFSVAVSGDTAVAGAFWEDGGGAEAGAAYIFERDQGGADNWVEVAKLIASDALANDVFGISVAISGDTVVVGAPQANLEYVDEGAVYVFGRNQGGAGNWGEVKKLTASDAHPFDEFGWSVAVSGDTAVVGAHFEDDGGSDAGAAYVFERDQGGAGNWGELKKLTASDAETEDEFGLNVAVSGDTAVVGAYLEDAGGTDAGAVYLFQRDLGGAANWGEVKHLLASDAQPSDGFGISVAVSGDTAVVGATLEDAGGVNAGAAYVFVRNQGGSDNWGEVKKLTASDAQEFDRFGRSVAVSGGTVVVGARLEDAGGGSAGAAYVYQRDQGGTDNWGEVAKLTASDAESGDNLGISVAASGDTAVVGAPFEVTGGLLAGAAYVFDLLQPKLTPTTTSTPTATPTITPTPTVTPTPCSPDCIAMSLEASGPVDCGAGLGVPVAKPAKCIAIFNPGDPKAAEFQIVLQGNNLPEISGFIGQVLFGAGLVWNVKATCADHVIMPDTVNCTFANLDAFTAAVAAATGVISPFVAATGTPGDIDLAIFNVHCDGQGSFKVITTLNPPSAFGATFYDVPNGNPIVVTEQGGEAGEADSLSINCFIPPTPQPEPGDTDHDGCSDAQENGTTPGQGGLRNFLYFWDVFDTDTENGLNAGTSLTGTVTIEDIFAVAGHFGDTGDPGIDPLSDASGAGYHTRFDRGDQIGQNSWNRAPPDGAITIEDIFAAAAQFGLNC